MRFRNKNGSLNLSIQAIVILVMAMAILGLGLGFIRTLIGKGQAQFTTAIDNAELENPATADNPLTVDRVVQVKSGDTGLMKLGFFNKNTKNTYSTHFIFKPFFYDKITSSTGAINTNPSDNCSKYFDLTTTDLDVQIGKSQGFQIIVKDAKKYGTGNDEAVPVGKKFLCTIELRGKTAATKYKKLVESKQFYLEVSS